MDFIVQDFVPVVYKVSFLCVVLVKHILSHGVPGHLCVFMPLHTTKGVRNSPFFPSCFQHVEFYSTYAIFVLPKLFSCLFFSFTCIAFISFVLASFSACKQFEREAKEKKLELAVLCSRISLH